MFEKQGKCGNRDKEIIGCIEKIHHFHRPEMIILLYPDSGMHTEKCEVPLYEIGIQPEREEHRDEAADLIRQRRPLDRALPLIPDEIDGPVVRQSLLKQARLAAATPSVQDDERTVIPAKRVVQPGELILSIQEGETHFVPASGHILRSYPPVKDLS